MKLCVRILYTIVVLPLHSLGLTQQEQAIADRIKNKGVEIKQSLHQEGADLTEKQLHDLCKGRPSAGALVGKETVLVIVDMQTCFCGTPLFEKEARAVALTEEEKGVLEYLHKRHPLASVTNRAPIEPIKKLMQRLQAAGGTIVVTRDCHVASRDWKEFCRFGAHCLCSDDTSTQVIPELDELLRNVEKPGGDISIKKPTYDAFFNTDLDQQLKSRGIKNLIVVGVLANVCVFHSAAHGALLGYNVFVPADCIAGIPLGVPTAAQSLTKKPGELFLRNAPSEATSVADKNGPAAEGGVTHKDYALFHIRWLFGDTVAYGQDINFVGKGLSNSPAQAS